MWGGVISRAREKGFLAWHFLGFRILCVGAPLLAKKDTSGGIKRAKD